MTFGEKLHKLRKEKGWTQEELASQINISRQALSKWEQGNALPDTENVLQISRIFGVSTDYLLHDEFESDADLPAVQNTGKKLKGQMQRILGLAISALGLVGLLVLAIAGFNYREEYPMTPEGVVSTARGLGLLLERYSLHWLLALLPAATIAGLAVAFWPREKKK